jgi:uncharacterized membrane protein
VERQQDQPQEVSGAEVIAPRQAIFRRLEHHVLRRIASGFLVLVPLIITILILLFAFRQVEGIFRPFLQNRTLGGTPLYFPGLGMFIMLVLLYVIGAFFAGRGFQSWQDAVLTKIPVVRTIYGVARQTTAGLTSSSGHHYNRVVFVEWPRPGVRAMGFVTGHLVGVNNDGSPLVAVYIPTVPNPTSGMLAFFPEKDIIDTTITVQEAMKTVFSGGIVLPELPERRELRGSSQFDEEFTP